MAENTRIPLRVKYISKDIPFQGPFEEGVLYFVEAQNTIYKDGVIPFGGINNVTFVENGTTTEIRFDNDGSGDGSLGKLVVGNNNLKELVEQLAERLTIAEKDIQYIELTTSNVYNLDAIAPRETVPYNLQSAINYIVTLDGVVLPNLGVIFNNGTEPELYYFKGNNVAQLNDTDYWVKVTMGDERIQHYSTRSNFPVVGEPNKLYIDESGNELWYWDDLHITYKQCGFDPLNITLINSNFN